MASSVVIRKVHEQDYDGWRPLWTQYNAFYGREGTTALSDLVSRRTWQRFLDPDTPVHGLVAQQNDRLVGLAHFVFHLNTIMIAETCYLQDLFTDPAARGRGVGRRLISGVCEAAIDAGTQSIYWHTQSSNATAMRLYDQVATNTYFTVYRKSFDTSAV